MESAREASGYTLGQVIIQIFNIYEIKVDNKYKSSDDDLTILLLNENCNFLEHELFHILDLIDCVLAYLILTTSYHEC